MTPEQARDEWERIRDRIDDCAIQANRVFNDPDPVNDEDVLVMREQLEQVQRLLLELRRGLE